MIRIASNLRICVGRALALCAGLLYAGTAGAVALNVQLTDPGNGVMRDTVVYAEPVGPRRTTVAPKGAVIDQIKKEFVPHVSVMQAGAAVSFPNNDNIRHQVYSYSQAKTFELKLYHGMPSQPVVFDKPGTVVLGCNIHDRMVGYVLVVDTPYFAKAGDDGHVRLDGLAPGEYEIRAWQPLPGGASAVAAQRIKITAGTDAAATLKLELKPTAAASR
jgi:plastocyanin